MHLPEQLHSVYKCLLFSHIAISHSTKNCGDICNYENIKSSKSVWGLYVACCQPRWALRCKYVYVQRLKSPERYFRHELLPLERHLKIYHLQKSRLETLISSLAYFSTL